MENERVLTEKDIEKGNEELKEIGITLESIKDFSNVDFSKSNNFLYGFYDDLTLNEIRLINTLLFIFNTYSMMTKKNEDKREWFKHIFITQGFFRFSFKELIKIMKIPKNTMTTEDLTLSLQKIRNKELKYLKFTESGKSITHFTSFITSFQIINQKDIFNNEIQKETTIKLYFDKNLFNDIFNYTKIGYTTLNINMNKLTSRISIGLYEELKRITPLKQIRKKNNNYSISDKFKENHSYKLTELNNIFGTNFKHLSQLKIKILNQYQKILNEKLLDDIYKFHFTSSNMEIEIVRPFFEYELEELELKKLKKGLTK